MFELKLQNVYGQFHGGVWNVHGTFHDHFMFIHDKFMEHSIKQPYILVCIDFISVPSISSVSTLEQLTKLSLNDSAHLKFDL